jgi:hypothetical protein
VQMTWKVSVDRTGKTADIAGVSSEQAIMHLEMEASQAGAQQQGPMAVSRMTIDSWHGKPAGWEDAQKALAKLAEKMVMGNSGIAAFAQTSAGGMEGMQQAAKEMAKLGGIPMRSITRMAGPAGMGGEGGSAPAAETKREDPKDAAAGAVLRGLGGFGRFGKKKPKEEPKKEEAAAAEPQPAAGSSSDGVLMEMTSEVVSYTSDPVDPAVMTVPAGFKMVEHPMRKMLEKNK